MLQNIDFENTLTFNFCLFVKHNISVQALIQTSSENCIKNLDVCVHISFAHLTLTMNRFMLALSDNKITICISSKPCIFLCHSLSLVFIPSLLSFYLYFFPFYVSIPLFSLSLIPIFTFLPFPLPGLLSFSLFILLLFLNLFHELFLSLSEFCRRRQSVASIRRIGNTLYLTRVIGTHRKPRTFSMIYKLNKGASINDVTSHFGEKGCEIVHGINGASVNHVTILWKDCQV